MSAKEKVSLDVDQQESKGGTSSGTFSVHQSIWQMNEPIDVDSYEPTVKHETLPIITKVESISDTPKEADVSEKTKASAMSRVCNLLGLDTKWPLKIRKEELRKRIKKVDHGLNLENLRVKTCKSIFISQMPTWFEYVHVKALIQLMSDFDVDTDTYYIDMFKDFKNQKTGECLLRFMENKDCIKLFENLQGIQLKDGPIIVKLDLDHEIAEGRDRNNLTIDERFLRFKVKCEQKNENERDNVQETGSTTTIKMETENEGSNIDFQWIEPVIKTEILDYSPEYEIENNLEVKQETIIQSGSLKTEVSVDPEEPEETNESNNQNVEDFPNSPIVYDHNFFNCKIVHIKNLKGACKKGLYNDVVKSWIRNDVGLDVLYNFRKVLQDDKKTPTGDVILEFSKHREAKKVQKKLNGFVYKGKTLAAAMGIGYEIKPQITVSDLKAFALKRKSLYGSNEDDGQQPAKRARTDAPSSTPETAYNHTMADQPEPMNLTDIPSRSNVLTDAQDAAASTSATPFAEPPTIAAPKSKAQKQREYRQRIAASRTPAQAIAARKSDAERQRNSRLRKAANSVLVSGSLESTIASASHSGARSNDDVQSDTQGQLTHQGQTSASEPAQITVQPGTSSDQIEVQQAQSTWTIKWASSIMRFKLTFLDNDFGHACSVCDRLWFKNDLKPISAAQLEVISEWFIKENRRLCREEYEMVCNTCKRLLNKKSMPPLAKFNGFTYPDEPPGLPPLDPISERLISPRLPFMQVRRLRHDLCYGIIEQVINVPVDEQEMVKCLPRHLNQDDVINVNIKRNLAHKSVYISGYMSKSTISAWLTVLQKSPLYRLYEINVDLSRLHPTVPCLDDIQDDPSNCIENISAENTPESEILASRQHTMMWNEEDCLNIAPGHQATASNNIYDRHAEELSFPSIYFGEPRQFNKGVSVSPYMIATSEIRRRDRRGATPLKILYVAMKMLRLRMVNGIYSTFRNVSVTENVTRRMLEDTEFMKEYVIQNLAFMKTVPNSVQYWASRKRDLFALIRQLGKPTIFLTISANETRWMKLLTILLKLSKKYPGKTAKDLNTSERCTLVSDDPVTCCIYFYKLIGSLMKMLKSKQTYNPFGKYFVKDYFLRIEFQHRGSPHAHILLWLNDDPRETVSENMPRTIDLVEKISSVARDDVPNNSIYANQIHKHTFTCTKQGETTCRFGIPYWPMPTTSVLVPIPQSDGRRQTLQQKAKELRTSLGERRYACMDEFLNANGLTLVSYLDIVRSTLRRPTLVFKRNFDELMTNTFNPYLAGEVNSSIDIQFILDEYSCAEYVVEYVNKSNRGMSNLRRELTTMMQEHPDKDYIGYLKALSIKLLNAVEMSAQEAAWYLLRQPMSETSRQIVYIPTVWPTERQRCRKRRQQMDREGIDGDSTDVWTKNIIQRYEERPASLERVYLAEFASWYANANDFVDEEDDLHVDDDEDSEAVPEARTSRAPKEYRRRLLERVIRYRRYDIGETVNYKREMVLLYVQFRNEMTEIVDQNKFLQLFDDNKDTIMERHSLFETNLNIENVMKELEATMT